MRNWLSISFAWLAACGASVSPYASVAAGRIGCPADYIALSHVQKSSPQQSWVAQCGGDAYACSSNLDVRDPHARIVCSEIGGQHRVYGECRN